MDTNLLLPSTSLFDDNGRSSFCIPNGHGFLQDQIPFTSINVNGLGNAIVNVVTSTMPSAIPVRATCMFCEKKWEMASSGLGKSPEMKRLEEIAVDHVFREVIKTEDLRTVQEIISRCSKNVNVLNPVILCDACIMHFAHSEARILKAQKEYLEKMTGPKEFSEVLADPWLDVKRFAFQKLKSNEAAIIDKLQLIENFNLENNVSSLMKSLNSSPTAHTSAAAASSSSVTFHLPLAPVTSISNNEVTSLSVSRPLVTEASAMHCQISEAESVANNLIMEVSNNDNVQSATCQYTVSSVEVSSNSSSSAPSPNHEEVPVRTIIIHTDQTDTEIYQESDDGGKVNEVEMVPVVPPPPENDASEGEGNLVIDESQRQGQDNSNVGTSQDQEGESNKVEAEKNVKGKKKKENEDNTKNSDEIFEESDAEKRDAVPPSAVNKTRSSTANNLQANSKSPVIILKQLRSGSVARSPAPSTKAVSPPPKSTSSTTSTSSKKRKAPEPKKKLFQNSKTRKSTSNSRNKRPKRESLKETNEDETSESDDDAGTGVNQSKKTSKAQTEGTKEKCTNGVVGVLLSELGQTTTPAPAVKTTAKNLSDSVTTSGKKVFKIGNRYMTESSSSEDDDDDDEEEDDNSKKSIALIKNKSSSGSDSD